MKRVVSYALFEGERNANKPGYQERPYYWSYLPLLLRAHAECWPGWELWIYHDASLWGSEYGPSLVRAAASGLCRLIYAGESQAVCASMLWRMRPMFDPEVEYFATRDVDACPAPRELRYIERWIADQPGGVCHMFHDSDSHSGLMGGMGCYRAVGLRERLGHPAGPDDLARRFGRDLGVFGSDQDLLASLVGKADRIDRFPARDGRDPRDNFGHIGGAIQTQGPIAWYERFGAPDMKAAMRDAEPWGQLWSAVALASDPSPTYAFFLPITARLWMALGYRPLVQLVGTPAEWLADARLRLVLDETSRAGARIHWLGDPAPWYPSALSQWSRLFAHRTPRLHPSTWIVTSDVDMWPLSGEFFNRRTDGVALWYANAYAPVWSDAPKWPICYLGANANIWQEVMGGEGGVAEATRGLLTADIGPDPSRWTSPSWSDVQWFGDEESFGRRLRAWPRFPVGVLPIDRAGQPPVDRVDRSAFPAVATTAGFADAHLLRPGHSSENWPRIAPLVTDPDTRAWAETYREKFLELSK